MLCSGSKRPRWRARASAIAEPSLNGVISGSCFLPCGSIGSGARSVLANVPSSHRSPVGSIGPRSNITLPCELSESGDAVSMNGIRSVLRFGLGAWNGFLSLPNISLKASSCLRWAALSAGRSPSIEAENMTLLC